VSEQPAQTMAEIIAALPEEEWFVLMLHFKANLSIAEISAKIGAPERAVASVLSAARARLQASLNFPSPG